jgi:RanBP1 domain
LNPFSSISSNPATHLLSNHGGTTTTSVTSDSNADDTDTETYKDSQLNLMSNAGEEDEECLYEGRSRAMKFVEKQSDGKIEKAWETQGVGQLRLLVNKETKKARIVLRAEPSGRAVLNTSINRAIDYKVQPGSCQFLVPRADGSGVDLWGLRFKKEVTAEVEGALKSAKDSLPK